MVEWIQKCIQYSHYMDGNPIFLFFWNNGVFSGAIDGSHDSHWFNVTIKGFCEIRMRWDGTGRRASEEGAVMFFVARLYSFFFWCYHPVHL